MVSCFTSNFYNFAFFLFLLWVNLEFVDILNKVLMLTPCSIYREKNKYQTKIRIGSGQKNIKRLSLVTLNRVQRKAISRNGNLPAPKIFRIWISFEILAPKRRQMSSTSRPSIETFSKMATTPKRGSASQRLFNGTPFPATWDQCSKTIFSCNITAVQNYGKIYMHDFMFLISRYSCGHIWPCL